MNLAFHQFRKELRWLWPRWALFLAVLGFDLVFNLGWAFPMKAGAVQGFSELSCVLLWIVAWWVALSTAPEDEADAGRAFAWTRPLPRRSYWLARLLVWLLLIVLPMMLEVGAYLALMRRPWTEVCLGMLEELLTAGSMTLWVLPGALLFRGWERYVALVIFIALWAADYGRMLLRPLFELVYLEPVLSYPFMEPLRFALVGFVMGPLMVLLLVWQQRRRMSLLQRHAAFAALALATYALAASPLLRGGFDPAVDAAFVQRFSQEHPPIIRNEDFQVGAYTDEKLGRCLSLSVPVGLKDSPRGMIPLWSSASATVTQNGRALPIETRELQILKDPSFITYGLHGRPLAGDLPPGWPADSLSVDTNDDKDTLRLPKMPLPPDRDTPVDIDMQAAANWVRLRELGHTPLKAGARIRSAEAEIEVLEVRLDVDAQGSPKPDAVTLVVRQFMRTLSTCGFIWPVQPMMVIHAPGKRLLWQHTVHGGGDWRAMRLGWLQTVMAITYGNVMKPGTGVTQGNLGEQQLLLLMPDYLGKSLHHVEVKGLDIGKDGRRPGEGPWTTAAVDQASNPRQGFLKAAQRIVRPSLDAPVEEAARYVAAVYSASRVYQERENTNSYAESLWPGDDREVAEMLAPYVAKHPELVSRLNLLSRKDFTDPVLRAALVNAGVPGFQRDPGAGQPFYQRTLPVPGQPNTVQSFTGDLWGEEYDGENVLPVVKRMLETRSDEPMRELLARRTFSLEKVWQEFPAAVNVRNLRVFVRDPAYRDKAVAEVNRQYAALPATARTSETAIIRVIAAKAVLGDATALGWLLRNAGLQNEENGHGLSAFHEAHGALFDFNVPLREVPAFIRNCREWTSDDFLYDAEKMIWVLKTGTTTTPPTPKP